MSKKLTIVARIEANPDQIEFVKAQLMKLIEPTLNEAGCIQYDLHQDNDNPRCFYSMKIGKAVNFGRTT